MINEYHNAIRSHVEREQKQAILSHSLLLYQTQADEKYDHTLVSLRIYGSRNYHDVVRVCLGLSSPFEPVPLGMFYFPTLHKLLALKKQWDKI